MGKRSNWNKNKLWKNVISFISLKPLVLPQFSLHYHLFINFTFCPLPLKIPECPSVLQNPSLSTNLSSSLSKPKLLNTNGSKDSKCTLEATVNTWFQFQLGFSADQQSFPCLLIISVPHRLCQTRSLHYLLIPELNSMSYQKAIL